MSAQLSEQEDALGQVQSHQEELASQVQALNSKLGNVEAEAKAATQVATAAHHRMDTGADANSVSSDEDDNPLSAKYSALATNAKKKEKRAKRKREKKPPKSEKEKKGAKRKAPASTAPVGTAPAGTAPAGNRNFRQIQAQRVAEEAKWSNLLLSTEESKKLVLQFASMLEEMGCNATPSKMADLLVTNFNDPPLIVDVNGSLKVDLETLAAVHADSVVDRWMAQALSADGAST